MLLNIFGAFSCKYSRNKSKLFFISSGASYIKCFTCSKSKLVRTIKSIYQGKFLYTLLSYYFNAEKISFPIIRGDI